MEDAITRKQLLVREQLLGISIKREHDPAPGLPPIPDVQALAAFLSGHVQDQPIGPHSRCQGKFKPVPVLIRAKAGTGKSWTMRQLVYLLAAAVLDDTSGDWKKELNAEKADCYVNTRTGAVQRELPEKLSVVHSHRADGSVRFPPVPLLLLVQRLATLVRTVPQGAEMCAVSLVQFYITHTIVKPSQREFLLQAYRMKTLVILVDGVDEAADLRDVLVDMLFSQLYASGQCLVVTTRPEGLSPEAFERFKGRFLILDLDPLSDEQQHKIVAQQLKDNECFRNLSLFKEVCTSCAIKEGLVYFELFS